MIIITTITTIIIDHSVTALLWLTVKLSCTCCRWAQAVQWRRETLRRLSNRQQN